MQIHRAGIILHRNHEPKRGFHAFKPLHVCFGIATNNLIKNVEFFMGEVYRWQMMISKRYYEKP